MILIFPNYFTNISSSIVTLCWFRLIFTFFYFFSFILLIFISILFQNRYILLRYVTIFFCFFTCFVVDNLLWKLWITLWITLNSHFEFTSCSQSFVFKIIFFMFILRFLLIMCTDVFGTEQKSFKIKKLLKSSSLTL